MCPGISIYDNDRPNGGKVCKRPDYTNPTKSVLFKIDKDGHCDESDLGLCATTATQAVVAAGNVAANVAKSAAYATVGTLAGVASVLTQSEQLGRIAVGNLAASVDSIGDIKNASKDAKKQVKDAEKQVKNLIS